MQNSHSLLGLVSFNFLSSCWQQTFRWGRHPKNYLFFRTLDPWGGLVGGVRCLGQSPKKSFLGGCSLMIWNDLSIISFFAITECQNANMLSNFFPPKILNVHLSITILIIRTNQHLWRVKFRQQISKADKVERTCQTLVGIDLKRRHICCKGQFQVLLSTVHCPSGF